MNYNEMIKQISAYDLNKVTIGNYDDYYLNKSQELQPFISFDHNTHTVTICKYSHHYEAANYDNNNITPDELYGYYTQFKNPQKMIQIDQRKDQLKKDFL